MNSRRAGRLPWPWTRDATGYLGRRALLAFASMLWLRRTLGLVTMCRGVARLPRRRTGPAGGRPGKLGEPGRSNASLGRNRRTGPADPRIDGAASERGDVPGWVLVTLMTAGLVIAIWTVAGPALVNLFNTAIERIRNF